MSTSSIPHSINSINDVNIDVQSLKNFDKNCGQNNNNNDNKINKNNDKYATIEKCTNLNRSQSNATIKRFSFKNRNYDWLRPSSLDSHKQKCVRHLIKSKSDATANIEKNNAMNPKPSKIMQNSSNKAVNRNGTIARNHFRGVPGEFLDKQTRHFLLSMTVSKIVHILCSFLIVLTVRLVSMAL